MVMQQQHCLTTHFPECISAISDTWGIPRMGIKSRGNGTKIGIAGPWRLISALQTIIANFTASLLSPASEYSWLYICIPETFGHPPPRHTKFTALLDPTSLPRTEPYVPLTRSMGNLIAFKTLKCDTFSYKISPAICKAIYISLWSALSASQKGCCPEAPGPSSWGRDPWKLWSNCSPARFQLCLVSMGTSFPWPFVVVIVVVDLFVTSSWCAAQDTSASRWLEL